MQVSNVQDEQLLRFDGTIQLKIEIVARLISIFGRAML